MVVSKGCQLGVKGCQLVWRGSLVSWQRTLDVQPMETARSSMTGTSLTAAPWQGLAQSKTAAAKTARRAISCACCTATRGKGAWVYVVESDEAARGRATAEQHESALARGSRGRDQARGRGRAHRRRPRRARYMKCTPVFGRSTLYRGYRVSTFFGKKDSYR